MCNFRTRRNSPEIFDKYPDYNPLVPNRFAACDTPIGKVRNMREARRAVAPERFVNALNVNAPSFYPHVLTQACWSDGFRSDYRKLILA